MPAGQPYTATLFDAYMESLLEQDALLTSYCPGGFWSEQIPETQSRPAVRWWPRIDQPDTIRQDGFAGRAQSNVEYVICVCDVQPTQKVDRIYGTLGMAQSPPYPHYFELAVLRLARLIHNYLGNYEGYDFYTLCVKDYQSTIPVRSTEDLEVCVGFIVQVRVS